MIKLNFFNLVKMYAMIFYIFKLRYQIHKNDMTDIIKTSPYLYLIFLWFISYFTQHNPHGLD